MSLPNTLTGGGGTAGAGAGVAGGAGVAAGVTAAVFVSAVGAVLQPASTAPDTAMAESCRNWRRDGAGIPDDFDAE